MSSTGVSNRRTSRERGFSATMSPCETASEMLCLDSMYLGRMSKLLCIMSTYVCLMDSFVCGFESQPCLY